MPVTCFVCCEKHFIENWLFQPIRLASYGCLAHLYCKTSRIFRWFSKKKWKCRVDFRWNSKKKFENPGKCFFGFFLHLTLRDVSEMLEMCPGGAKGVFSPVCHFGPSAPGHMKSAQSCGMCATLATAAKILTRGTLSASWAMVQNRKFWSFDPLHARADSGASVCIQQH